MKLRIIASGSSGNCHCIENNNEYIFVDVGASVSKISNEIGQLDDNSKISLFITHEHTDHISGFMPMVRKYMPKIYTSEKTADILLSKGANPDYMYVLDADCCYDMDSFSVTPFRLNHDAVEPFGYKFNFGENIISFATDFGIVTDYLRRAVEKSNILILESNYEEELLKTSPYPEYLKSRILSKKGHLSNKDACKFVGEMSLSGLKRCFLAHISENSNDYRLLERYAKTCKDCYNVDTEVIRQRSSVVVSV